MMRVRQEIRWSVPKRITVEQLKEDMLLIFTTLGFLAAAGLLAAERSGALKYLLLISGILLLNGCLSFTATERPAPVATVSRTETVYVTENGTRVRRIVTVDASGRRYYSEDGRTVYVDHYGY